MKDIYLVRGLPGSGKTALAESLAQGSPIYSADDFFIRDGKYEYDPSQIPDAHFICQLLVEAAMYRSVPRVFVTNTFVEDWELEPYENMAVKYGYRVFYMVVENRHGNANIHDVPADKVADMAGRFSLRL